MNGVDYIQMGNVEISCRTRGFSVIFGEINDLVASGNIEFRPLGRVVMIVNPFNPAISIVPLCTKHSMAREGT